MFPYFIMIGLPSLFAIAARRPLQASILLGIVFVLFLSVIGLRFEIGPDWYNYSTHFARYETMPLAAMIADGEIGWGLLVRTIDLLGGGMTTLVFISAVVYCIGLFSLARSCQEPMLALVAAIPYLSIAVAMSGLRQAMAIGIIFFLLSRWYRWGTPAKLAAIVAAASFHFSALALLPIIILETRMTPVQRIGGAIVVGAIVTYLVGTAGSRIDEYAGNYLGGEASNAPGAVFHVMLTAGPALAYFFFRRRWIKIYGKIPIVDWFAAIGAFAMIPVFLFPTATDRMTLYFAGVALIIQANLPRLWKDSTEQFLVRTAIVVLNVVAMATFLFAGNKSTSFVPYQSVFSDATLTASRTHPNP